MISINGVGWNLRLQEFSDAAVVSVVYSGEIFEQHG